MGNRVVKPNQPDEEQGGDVTSFACEICTEQVSSDKKFKNREKCGHSSYCIDCIAKYIQAKVEEYNLSEIKCPGLDCDKFLDPLTCRSFLSEANFVRWSDALCGSTISWYERAYCPFQDCSSLILNECGGKIKETKCPCCKRDFCFGCKIPWQADHSCSSGKTTGQSGFTDDNLMEKMMVEKKWRRCPSCDHVVELRSGCPSVKCRCGTLFCHFCGKRRSGRHWCWRVENGAPQLNVSLETDDPTLLVILLIPILLFVCMSLF